MAAIKNEELETETETEEEETEEDETEDEENGKDGNTDDTDTLVDSWETENGLIFELHGFSDHDEILAVEIEEDPGKDDHTVALALNLEDLDEAIDLLKEIREKMLERRALAKVRTKARR